MVLVVVLDVPDHPSYTGLADRKGPVSALPMEISVSSCLGLDPFRRVLLHALDHLTQGMVFGEMEQDVGMVLDRVDQDSWRVHSLQDRSHVGMQFRPDVIRKNGFAALGTKDQMNQNLS
jgi:hypothetical protein